MALADVLRYLVVANELMSPHTNHRGLMRGEIVGGNICWQPQANIRVASTEDLHSHVSLAITLSVDISMLTALSSVLRAVCSVPATLTL